MKKNKLEKTCLGLKKSTSGWKKKNAVQLGKTYQLGRNMTVGKKNTLRVKRTNVGFGVKKKKRTELKKKPSLLLNHGIHFIGILSCKMQIAKCENDPSRYVH